MKVNGIKIRNFKHLLEILDNMKDEFTEFEFLGVCRTPRREDRIAVIREAKEKIEQRAEQRYKKEEHEYQDKIEKRKAKD